MTIERLTPESALTYLPGLVALLQDAVESGAGMGFLSPLPTADAEAHWRAIISDLSLNQRILLVDQVAGQVTGSVQLELATNTSGLHRAEVQKFMVARPYRGQGIARRLLEAIEDAGREAGRSTLVLHTRQGDVAEGIYRKLGYTEAGVIPRFARSANGVFHNTVWFYKLLS